MSYALVGEQQARSDRCAGRALCWGDPRQCGAEPTGGGFFNLRENMTKKLILMSAMAAILAVGELAESRGCICR